ncbi:hypothetical protein FPV67DRAFT_1086063 [Lyophyllum atratum]|nr:hypothetical protein FPV67DRAFT_1086063 [Lyophyllum atratum]
MEERMDSLADNLRVTLARYGVDLYEKDVAGTKRWYFSSDSRAIRKTERNSWHQIQRRTLAEKAVVALKRKYWIYPTFDDESFEHWSMRVNYPDCRRIARVVKAAKHQGNRVAHQATREQMESMLGFEEEVGSEVEILQEMFNIVDEQLGWDVDQNIDDEDSC